MFILTTHAHQRIHERAITPDEIAAVTQAAHGLIVAIRGDPVKLRHRGLTMIVGEGGVVVSVWRSK